MKNNHGMTLVEIMVAVGMMGGLALGVMSISKNQGSITQSSNQEQRISEFSRIISANFNNKVSCDRIVPSFGTLDISSLDAIDLGSVIFTGSEFLSPSFSGGVEVLPVSVLLKFDRKNSAGGIRKTIRKVSFLGQFKDSAFSGCVDYESHAIQTSFKIGCETLGGVYVYDTFGAESCDYSQINENSPFAKGLRKSICEEVYGGAFNSATKKCMNIEVSGEVTGQNISPGHFSINGQTRTSFTQMCSGANTFIVGINVDGSVVCKTVTTCTKGLDCGGGSPPVVVTPPPSVCTNGDTRVIEGEGTMCSCPVAKPYMCNPRITQVCSSGSWSEVSCMTGGCEAMSCI